MLRKLHCAALALLAATAANPSPAQTPNLAPPPPWRDDASVYLSLDQTVPAPIAPTDSGATKIEQPELQVAANTRTALPPTAQSPPPTPPAYDPSVQHAFHQTVAAPAANDSQRRLAPPSAALAHPAIQRHRTASSRPVPSFSLPWESVSTMVAALGIVVGLFLICTWLLRRGTRKMASALPRDVVSVLGRVPLATRNVAQLLRVGNKLVLVSLTPSGAETLTEVTDPTEVDRLVGLCQQFDPHSATKAFEQVFRQMSREPAPDGFLGQEAPFGPTIPPYEARHPYRGDAARA